MPSDLKSKLDRYNRGVPIKTSQGIRTGLEVQDLVEGKLLHNDDGCCFAAEQRIPISTLYGGYTLDRALELDMRVLQKAFPEMDQVHPVRDYLFLDTETTGLSGGTGTVAFMIGTGFFEGDEFIIRQYFMRDYDEEPAALREINRLLTVYKGLVTFNGKAFDWNLLLSRFTFHRIRPALAEPVHIDLLYPSRRLWKLKLESCRLASLEESILGEYRIGDIPGAMIPTIYFQYLEDRDASVLKQVFAHNVQDIQSMVPLLVKIHALLDNPEKESDGSHELLGIGGILERTGELAAGVECYEKCLLSMDVGVHEHASKRLIRMYKRNREFVRLIAHCEQEIVRHPHAIPPRIELAKVCEHHVKDYEKALRLTEEAIACAMKLGLQQLHLGELKKRRDRLKRKTLLSSSPNVVR